MCLLVISNWSEKLDLARRLYVSRKINALIEQARVAQRPLAFLQGTKGVSFDGIGLRIGRYEPIFTASDFGGTLPSGLIDFIVGSAAREIQLAGVASFYSFERLLGVLHRSGYTTMIGVKSVLFVDKIGADDVYGAYGPPQLIENDPFTEGLVVRSASMKNQSTRWPNA
jgi:hypothetical protein